MQFLEDTLKPIHDNTKRRVVKPKNNHTLQPKNNKKYEKLSLQQNTVPQNRSAGTPGDGAPQVGIGSCRGSFGLPNPFKYEA